MFYRREFLELLAAAALGPRDYPVRKPRVEPLWPSPDRYPNALEATGDGLWVWRAAHQQGLSPGLEDGQAVAGGSLPSPPTPAAWPTAAVTSGWRPTDPL